MIKTGIYDYYGKDCSYITIDLSDKKHKNRVLDIEETKNIDDTITYDIKVQWTASQYHPTMMMKEDDIIDLADALKKEKNKILERRNK